MSIGVPVLRLVYHGDEIFLHGIAMHSNLDVLDQLI
jgi:hypothetical protein